MQYQWNFYLFGNGFYFGKFQLGFIFIQIMGGVQCGGEVIYLGFCYQGVVFLGIGVDDFGIDNVVFIVGDGFQFGFYRDIFVVGQCYQVVGNGQVFFEWQM